MDNSFYAPYLEAYKLFKITGKASYIMVISNVIFGTDIDFNGIYYTKIDDRHALPHGMVIACSIEDLTAEQPYPFDQHIYNILNDYISFYTFAWPDYNKIEEDVSNQIYAMKSYDSAKVVTLHMENDINVEYMLPLFYNMYPLSKGDTVDTYIRLYSGNYITKSVVHKKKQHMDIVVYRRFLKVV